ncbi:hypothetical protein SAMN05216522_10224 [Rosenbergiella nectarea]|uniref:Uncharacterized protein n=1 Tax=Rosenbergiella nectarea TaxID=988801 RepID=A0A1H9ERZ1_9GAMM|nr:hypothetical protein [Rosenbergiella nectarea]SEQ27963.1 hypothetical protein SAMN05216522_10224 [Rosenbergiella nectarea]
MLDQEVALHLDAIKKQIKANQIAVQLLVSQMLKIIETKPNCENIINEITDSLEEIKSQAWFGKEGIDAAISLTKIPVKYK